MRLSIIIPVYKAEKYLRRCLDSVLAGVPVDDIEVIAVNDGSPDNSLDILREYENQYPCVRVIDKPNGGVSSARNAGLDVATGKYVMFVDADDAVDPEALKKLLLTDYTKHNIVVAGYHRISRHNNESIITRVCDENSFNVVTSDWYVLNQDFLTIGVSWAKLYARDIISKYSLRFDVSMPLFEDSLFNYSFLKHTDSVCLSGEIIYNYYLNYNSSTVKFRGDEFIHCVNTYVASMPESLRTKSLAFQTYFGLFTIYRSNNRPKHKYKWFRRYMNNYYANGGDDIRKYFTVGFTKIFGIVTSIHPRLGHYLLKTAFVVERLKKRLKKTQ